MSQDTDEIVFVAKETLEGHQRAIMGNMTVEEIYRDNFPLEVRLHLASWIEENFSPKVPFNANDPGMKFNRKHLVWLVASRFEYSSVTCPNWLP